MEANYCADCGVEGIVDPADPSRWNCPICKRDILLIGICDDLKLKDEIGTHGKSAECHDGLPERESARHVDKDGGGSGIDIERGEGGVSKVTRRMRRAAPLPRDPSGDRKRAEEQQAVRILIPTYNHLHGSLYQMLAAGKDDQGEDVIAESSKDGESSIRFQVTFADSDGALRASISKGKPYSAEESEKELLARTATALQKKSLSPDYDVVLVLDGAGIVTPPGSVERFVKDYRELLKVAPFREVWWVDHAPGGVIRRLWPEH